MPDLPKKEVGIVACSGEELAEGTVTRLASLKVLEQLRPYETVTICLPLFLAGGEQDRAFARFYPTIAVDGCEKRCAARGTEMHSGKPAAEIVVTDLIGRDHPGDGLGSGRRLSAAGTGAVGAVAERIAWTVDELLGVKWDRRRGKPIREERTGTAEEQEEAQAKVATCACGSGIPIQKVQVNGSEVTFIALPLIFERFQQQGKSPEDGTAEELMETVKIYTPVPEGEEELYAEAVMREYARYCEEES
ncbi:MAG: putative zinc-binding protein [Anaerolineae bacterium]